MQQIDTGFKQWIIGTGIRNTKVYRFVTQSLQNGSTNFNTILFKYGQKGNTEEFNSLYLSYWNKLKYVKPKMFCAD